MSAIASSTTRRERAERIVVLLDLRAEFPAVARRQRVGIHDVLRRRDDFAERMAEDRCVDVDAALFVLPLICEGRLLNLRER